jgi:drug/metabolite transporter (DMT)-like permease
LTEGLKREKAGRATNLIVSFQGPDTGKFSLTAHQYTQMIFALIIERVVWGTTPPLTSLVGGALIIGAAVWVSLQKKATVDQSKPVVDEERQLLNPSNEADPR